MPPDLSSIRKQLATLTGRKRARRYGWPRDWQPGTVTNPEDGNPFTMQGAWEFIAELLSQGVELEHVIIDEAKGGKSAYVIKTELNNRQLYIKLQLGNGCIIGRSFHYTYHEQG